MKAALKSYWKYFKYILEHKKNVFIECWKEGLYFHGFTHDLSKFSPAEFLAYADKFYGGDYAYKYFDVEGSFEDAWLHHQRHNKHHWDYWVNSEGVARPMPEKHIREMVCDWKAMSRKFGDTAKDYYLKNKGKIKLHPQTRKSLEYRLGLAGCFPITPL